MYTHRHTHIACNYNKEEYVLKIKTSFVALPDYMQFLNQIFDLFATYSIVTIFALRTECN